MISAIRACRGLEINTYGHIYEIILCRQLLKELFVFKETVNMLTRLGNQYLSMIILPSDGVNIDGVLSSIWIYWTFLQLVTTLYRPLSHKD
jgi:hypothetical protein